MKRDMLREALRDFMVARRILTEDYGMPQGYDDEDDYDDYDGYDDMPPRQGRQGMPQQDGEDISHYRGNNGQQQGQPQQGGDENTDMNLSKSDERIAQIREIALDGLQDYAQDVDCEAYQFYKKIWLMCDKAVSEKDNAGNGGSGM